VAEFAIFVGLMIWKSAVKLTVPLAFFGPCVDVDNDRIVRIARVDVVGERPGDDLVSSDGPDARAAKKQAGYC
jgi:hypothetical protein